MTLLWDDQTRLTDRLGELRVGRRTTIVAGLSGASVPALGLLGHSPALVERRRDLTSGVRSGEVTTSSAVIWSRAVTPSRLMVRLLSNGRQRRLVRGPWTDERADLTARVHLTGLAPGRPYDAEVWFESPDGERSAPSTSPSRPHRSTPPRSRSSGRATPAARGGASIAPEAG